MKRVNNIYNRITDINTIIDVYDNEVKRNTKNKIKVEEFDNYYSLNIKEIKEELMSGDYIPGEYNIFFIREPKLRIIMSQNIKDKIINHLVARYFLINVFEKGLIENNIATRNNKGTHYGLKLFKKYLNIMKNKYNNFYILKFDISKYFYNIDHDIVKEILRNKIKDKKVISLLDKIIDSTDKEYINKTIIKLNKNNEDISLYKKGKGFPIGNMTSQFIGIIYLNELDHFIKEKLKIKYYIRYMDDGVLIHENKEYLKYCLSEIERIVDKYKLSLNKKTRIYKISEGIEFLGFRFIIKNNKIIMKIKNNTKKRFKRRLNDRNISSYIGHLKYGDCSNLIYKVLKEKELV